MQLMKSEYCPELLEKWKETAVTESGVTELLGEYAKGFEAVIRLKSQREHFENYLKGLMSKLERKSVEPIALKITSEKGVRSLQQFMTRSNIDDDEILGYYQSIVAKTISSENGMLSVDGSDIPKKGNHSAGVGRQYCGTLGKVENCQAGVFCAYAGSGGYAIVERELYFQQKWFSDDFADKRLDCGVPNDRTFQTKNEIALAMIQKVVSKNLFDIKWIGCDSAFGCDHGFLDALPESIPYFVSVKNNERIFLNSSTEPVKISKISDDENIPWRKVLFEGSKGAAYSDVKIVRAKCSRTVKEKALPHSSIWLYIRKHPNGDVKYFISNAPDDIAEAELHEAATLRWSIEQCFLECKSHLGMDHFEGRTLGGLLRHWLFVMIAHFFTTSLRLTLKKTISPQQCQWRLC